MIKIGTVFSGIGSIEHALERMNIPTSIEFACDNGDVNIFSSPVEQNLAIIQAELLNLSALYKHTFSKQIQKAQHQLGEIVLELQRTSVDSQLIMQVYQRYLETGKLNSHQKNPIANCWNN